MSHEPYRVWLQGVVDQPIEIRTRQQIGLKQLLGVLA
jgi:hypothetical protein